MTYAAYANWYWQRVKEDPSKNSAVSFYTWLNEVHGISYEDYLEGLRQVSIAELSDSMSKAIRHAKLKKQSDLFNELIDT